MQDSIEHAVSRTGLGARLPPLLCALAVLNLLLTVWGRLRFPFPLEWMEGGTMQHALRLAQGQALYVEPGADFIPFLYPPLAYVPMALATLLVGAELPVLRAVSVLCMAGTLALAGRASTRWAGDRMAGLLAVAFLCLGYGYAGAFWDLARVDGFFLLCVAAGLERAAAGRLTWALACFALACLAKQHGLLFLVAAGAFVALPTPARTRANLLAVGLTLLTVLLAHGALDAASDGNFARYAFELPASHGIVPGLLFSFFFVDLLVYLPLLCLLVVLDLRFRLRRPALLDLLLLAGLVAGALGRAHPGGDDNVRLPALLLLCVAAAVPAARGLRHPAPWRRRGLALAIVLQALVLWQPPSAHQPSGDHASAFYTLMRALDRCGDGGHAPWLDFALPAQASLAHSMALSDVRMNPNQPLARQATRALLERLSGPEAPRLLVVGERFRALDLLLAQRYEPCGVAHSLPMVSGYQPRPQRIYRLRARPSAQLDRQ